MDYFERKILETFGDEGQAWLDQIPATISACAERWSLQVGPPFPELSYNYAAPAEQADGSPVVLKFGVPRAELLSEMAALRHYNGRGSVRLIDALPEQGVLLLERLMPGSMLTELCPDHDDQATEAAAAVMKNLWKPPPPEHDFLPVATWFEGLARLRAEFDGGCGPFPSKLLETAETLYAELSQSMSAPVLLHGDLHHYNILSSSKDSWLAIDPKGIIGEPAYEVGAFLRNPLGFPDWAGLDRLLGRRVAILSEQLGLDHGRIAGWGVAVTVLSSWWSYEDHDSEWWSVLPVAEKLSELLT